MYLLTAYYTPNDGLVPTIHHFIRTKLASYTLHVAVCFQSIVYAIIKITIRGTTVPLYEFVAKQPKKNIN